MPELGRKHGNFLRKFSRSPFVGPLIAVANSEKPLKSIEKLSINCTECYEGKGPAISVSAAEMGRFLGLVSFWGPKVLR